MPCSVEAPPYDQACGWRVIRKPNRDTEIWISNISVRDKPAYRVLQFSGGEFTARDGDQLQVSKESDVWSISVSNNEFYRQPKGQPKGASGSRRGRTKPID